MISSHIKQLSQSWRKVLSGEERGEKAASTPPRSFFFLPTHLFAPSAPFPRSERLEQATCAGYGTTVITMNNKLYSWLISGHLNQLWFKKKKKKKTVPRLSLSVGVFSNRSVMGSWQVQHGFFSTMISGNRPRIQIVLTVAPPQQQTTTTNFIEVQHITNNIIFPPTNSL